MKPTAPSSRGMTLIELMIAVAIGALVLASLNSVVALGVQAQALGRSANDLAYQGRFALERMTAKARGATPQPLSTPAANTSGSWFAPTMYCLNGSQQLIETATADSGCTGTTVIASKVGGFSAQQPASPGPVDEPVAVLGLTLTDAASGRTVTLSTSVRLGGGTL